MSTVITQPAALHQQDEHNLRSALGLGEGQPIPAPVLDAYYEIRRQQHRMIGGPMDVTMILLVLHASKGTELVPAPAEPEKAPEPPGRPLDTSEGMIDPDVPLVGGTPMYIKQGEDWCEAKYKGPGKDGRLRFTFNRKMVEVARSEVRFKE